MAQERKAKASARDEQDTVAEQPVQRDTSVSDDTDALLDEIDEVLEQDAEKFVKSYIQKGGE